MIPADIMQTATELVDRIAIHTWKGDCIADVAQAIQAERQRTSDLIEEVKAVLGPFAKLMPDTTRINGVWCKDYEDNRCFIVVDAISAFDFTMGNVRAVRALLSKLGER